jgi:hypothetical protein
VADAAVAIAPELSDVENRVLSFFCWLDDSENFSLQMSMIGVGSEVDDLCRAELRRLAESCGAKERRSKSHDGRIRLRKLGSDLRQGSGIQMGLPRRKGRRSGAGAKARRSKRKPPKKHGGTLRRFSGVVSDGEGPHVKITLEPHDPRYRAGTTIFPKSVTPASRLGRLLKSGHNSRKIGKTCTKGRLRGAPIYTLTLEERATCPRSCAPWAMCYGNSMPFAHRIFDDGTLTKRLWGELASLQADNPNGFLIRLHVLGDFFSTNMSNSGAARSMNFRRSTSSASRPGGRRIQSERDRGARPRSI